MVKKLFSLFMVVLLTLCLTITTYAKDTTTLVISTQSTVQRQSTVQSNVKLNSDDVIKLAKKALKDYFGLDLDEKAYQNSSQLIRDFGDTDTDVWMLNWDSFNGTMNKSINARVDANSGKILSVNINDNPNAQSGVQVAKYTEEEAQKAVESFLQKIDPQIIKNTLLTKIPYYKQYNGFSPTYDFRYIRLVNGIEYDANYVDVGYDGASGTVISYSNSWDDSVVFPAKGKVVDEQTATQNFSKALKMKLEYISTRDSTLSEQSQIIRLVYSPYFDDGAYIDASKGEVFKGNSSIENLEKTDLSDQDKKAFLENYKAIEKPDKEIDRGTAEKIAKGILDKIITTKGTITDMTYQNNYNGMSESSVWNGQFTTDSEDMPVGNISIDATTGELSQFYPYNNYYSQGNFVPKLTWKEAYAKAIDYIKQLYPDRIKDISTDQIYNMSKSYVNNVEVTNPIYNFSFMRKINDISAGFNSINIGINAKTGVLSNVYNNWDEALKLPNTTNIISSDAAHKAYMDSVKMTLGYVSYNKSTDSKVKDVETKLVYINRIGEFSSLGLPTYIDTSSGKLFDFNGGGSVDASDSEFSTKIKGNQYEKELAMMAASGSIDTKNFDPNKTITKGDVIKAMVLLKASGGYSSQQLPEIKFTDIKKSDNNYSILQKAVFYGILNNEATALNLSRVLTKEEVIKYLVDITPFGQLANSKGIFALNYNDVNDISADKYGYIAIAKGLKILEDDSKLEPKGNVKMDELYHYIYNTAQYITGN